MEKGNRELLSTCPRTPCSRAASTAAATPGHVASWSQVERVIARVESGSEACDTRTIFTSAANQVRLFLHAGALARLPPASSMAGPERTQPTTDGGSPVGV